MTRDNDTETETTDGHTDRGDRADGPDPGGVPPTDADASVDETENTNGDEGTTDTGSADPDSGTGFADGSASGSRVPPDPPTLSDPSADAAANPAGVLTLDDLERAARGLRELDDERVVVPTGDDPPASDAPDPDRTGHAGHAGPRDEHPPGGHPRDGDAAPATGATNGADGSVGLAGPTGHTEAETAYAVDVAVRTDHGPASESFRSNDVRVIFEELLRWYAGRIDPGRDPEAVLAVLLAASDLDVDAAGR